MIHPVDFRLGVSKFWNSKVCSFNFSNFFKNYIFYYKVNIFFNYLFYNSYILYLFNSGSVKKITGLIFKRKRSKAIRKNWGLGVHELTLRKRRFQRSVFAYKGIILFTYFYIFLFKGSLFIKLFFINSYLLVFSKKIYKYLSRVKRMKKYFDYDTAFVKNFLKKKKKLLMSEKRGIKLKLFDRNFYKFLGNSNLNNLNEFVLPISKKKKKINVILYKSGVARPMYIKNYKSDESFKLFINNLNKKKIKNNDLLKVKNLENSFIDFDLNNFDLSYYVRNIKLNYNLLVGIGKNLFNDNYLLKFLKNFVYYYLFNLFTKLKLKNYLIFFKMVKVYLLEIFSNRNINLFSKLLFKNKLKKFFFNFKKNLFLKSDIINKFKKSVVLKKPRQAFYKLQKKKNISLKYLANLSTFVISYKRLFYLKYDVFNDLLSRSRNEDEVMYNFFFKRNLRKYYYSIARNFMYKFDPFFKSKNFDKSNKKLYIRVDKFRKKKMKKYLNFQFSLDLNLEYIFNKLYSFIFIYFFFLSFIYKFLILYKKFYFLRKNLKFKLKRFLFSKSIGRKKNILYFFSGSINFVNIRVKNVRLFLNN